MSHYPFIFILAPQIICGNPRSSLHSVSRWGFLIRGPRVVGLAGEIFTSFAFPTAAKEIDLDGKSATLYSFSRFFIMEL